MKSGIELIAEERQKQIDKHGFTGKHHAEHPEWYNEGQLTIAASRLSNFTAYGMREPNNWSREWWENMCDRPYEERLKIAGALIAAELDRRLSEIESKTIMTKKEAIEIMKSGKWVKHAFFGTKERMTIRPDGRIHFEDGYAVHIDTFFEDRPGQAWDDGYTLAEDQSDVEE